MAETAPVEWLRSRSMLLKHDSLAERYSGHSVQWQNGFGRSRPLDVLDQNSVWFAAYPNSLVGGRGDKALDVLGSTELQKLLASVGVRAIHTGPMKRSGSVTGTSYGPSIDGHFDRIESEIDPAYGSEAKYQHMVEIASQHGIVVIGDLVPGHTGLGPDFRLATLNEPGFPGLYTMIEIDPADWSVLPDVAADHDSANLSQSDAQALKELGYAPIGSMDIEVFARPGIKESCWSATNVIRGVDGRERRWVYLHIFKQGQPSLNWSDPSFAAHRLMAADTMHSLSILGTKGLRLDATMFLGVETGGQSEQSWLGGHPLSTRVTDLLGMMIRKLGGFSFQELNTDLAEIRRSLESGSEFYYDFCTRPGYLYALVMGDGGPLRLMLRELLAFGIQPNRFVHGLQNHDELMLETTHLRVNGSKVFEYEGASERGDDLFRRIHEDVIAVTTGAGAPYNQSFAMSPGVCSTLPGLIAAAMGIADINEISQRQQEEIQHAHLLAAAFNALQGGVFLLSGWDLVGALPIPASSIGDLVADNDYRWINRGGYDLTGQARSGDRSIQRLPIAKSLYGGLDEQLQDPRSFASRLKSMLGLREILGIARGALIAVPTVKNKGAVVLVNALEGQPPSWQLAALNFGSSRISEAVSLPGLTGVAEARWSSRNGLISEKISLQDDSTIVDLEPMEAKLIVVSEPA